MPGAQVTVDNRAIRRILGGPNGPVARLVIGVRTQRVVRRAKAIAPRRTNEYANKIRGRVVSDSSNGLGFIGIVEALADHSWYVEKGTGIYGPMRRPIVAKPGKVFVFMGREGKLVFTTRIRGMRAQHVLERALEAAR